MHTDSHFWIGNDHKVCQDYSLAGEFEGKPYAIISDGCSDVKDSDFGARILARAAADSLPWFDTQDYGKITIELAQQHQRTLWLDSDVLFATLAVASVIDNRVVTKVYGDGYIAFKTEHQITLYEISYPSNAPYYLNYLVNENYRNSYISYGLNRIVTKYEIDIESSHIILKEEIYDQLEGPFVIERPIDSCFVVAVMSDGIGTFNILEQNSTSKQYIPVNIEDVIINLLAFKQYNGEFVYRRAQRFLEDCAKKNLGHDDDISIGAIYLK